MSVRLAVLPLYVALIVATGCDQAGPSAGSTAPATPTTSNAVPPTNSVAVLNTNVPLDFVPLSPLENAVLELRVQVAALETDFRRSKALSHPLEVTLDFSEKSFGSIYTSVGQLFIGTVDAQPYLDGYKLALNIGNPTTAQFEGITLHVTWGPKDLKGETPEERAASYKSTTVRVNEPLLPGKWNRVEINAVPAKPEAVRNVHVMVEVISVVLNNPSTK